MDERDGVGILRTSSDRCCRAKGTMRGSIEDGCEEAHVLLYDLPYGDLGQISARKVWAVEPRMKKGWWTSDGDVMGCSFQRAGSGGKSVMLDGIVDGRGG